MCWAQQFAGPTIFWVFASLGSFQPPLILETKGLCFKKTEKDWSTRTKGIAQKPLCFTDR